MKTDDLVSAMAQEMGPVKRLRPPLVRAALWLGFSVAVIAVIVAISGPREDLAQRLAKPWEAAQMAIAAVTAVLAAIAAFHLTLPDRSDRWALLPLPGLVLWIGTLGWGCVADFVRLGPDGMTLGTSFGCLGFILGLSLPMGGAMLFALRHAGPIRPVPTMAAGVLSVAMLASVGLSIVHHLDAAVMVLIWHVGAVAIATAIGGMVGGRALARQSALVQAVA